MLIDRQYRGLARTVRSNAAEEYGRIARVVAPRHMRRLKLSPGSAAIIVRCALQKALIQKRQALGADPEWNEQDGERDTLVLTTARCGIKAADEQAKEGPIAAMHWAPRQPSAPRSEAVQLGRGLHDSPGFPPTCLEEGIGCQLKHRRKR
jgi:hypothetical protein